MLEALKGNLHKPSAVNGLRGGNVAATIEKAHVSPRQLRRARRVASKKPSLVPKAARVYLT